MSRSILIFMLVILFPMLISCTTVDESKVVIELKAGVDTVEINTEFIDAGVTCTAYGFPIEHEILENTVDTTTIGQYHITYQVDYKNIIKTVTRIVYVIDETPPVGVLNQGVDSVEVGSEWIDASVTVSDNSLGDVTITVIGTVNINISGEYIITYLLEDSSGNTSSVDRYVFVYDLE